MSIQDLEYKINPLKKWRTRLNLSQRDLAYRADVTPQAVLKYEQGLYQDPSPNIVSAIMKAAVDHGYPISYDKLVADYRDWRIVHQVAQRWVFDRVLTLPVKPNEHPFITFRERLYNPQRVTNKGYSIQGFSVLLALHPATVSYYNSGRCREMPKAIHDGLVRAGCRENIIKELNELGCIYYDNHQSN